MLAVVVGLMILCIAIVHSVDAAIQQLVNFAFTPDITHAIT